LRKVAGQIWVINSEHTSIRNTTASNFSFANAIINRAEKPKMMNLYCWVYKGRGRHNSIF